IKDELKKAMDTNDMETLRNKINELEKVAARRQQYQNSQSAQNTDAGSNTNTSENNSDSSSQDQDVVDADFKEKH
ncbi:MAG: molecular chaperone DnaK, partial [Erysipelotrichales bacterium]|nr:molecular chaperone DnaK [Erysipelotrichales bacterium]